VSLHIVEKLVDDVLVLDLRGRLTLGPETETLRTRLRRVFEAGHRRVVLDLGAVSYLDSSGLATLVTGYTTARKAGGEMKLARLTKLVHDLLLITRLSTVFETYDTVDAAERSFERGQAPAPSAKSSGE
jgi:anti-sigma B factor antagonist